MLEERFINKVFPGDGIKFMGELPASCMDLMLTDIPYDVVNRDGGIRDMNKGKADVITFDLADFVSEATRVVCGSAVIFCSSEQAGRLIAMLEASGEWEDVVHGFWTKSNPSPQGGEHFFLNATESFVAARKPGAYFNPDKIGKPAVYECTIGTSKIHPTEKPEALFLEIVKDYTLPGDAVLDPCCGSGKTAIVAAKAGRTYTCFELDCDYAKMAGNRAAVSLHKMSLFGAAVRAKNRGEYHEKMVVLGMRKGISIEDGTVFMRKAGRASVGLVLTDISNPGTKPVSANDSLGEFFNELTRVVKGSAFIYCDSEQANVLRDMMDGSDDWKFVRHGVSTRHILVKRDMETGHAVSPRHFICAKKSGAFFSREGFCKRPVFDGEDITEDFVRMIASTTVAGDIIMDPCSGDGLVALAADSAGDCVSGLFGHRTTIHLVSDKDNLVESREYDGLDKHSDMVVAAQAEANSKASRAKRIEMEREERKLRKKGKDLRGLLFTADHCDL